MPDRRRSEYALPPLDPLDAAVIALGLTYEAALPDEELIEPTGFPPLAMDRRAPLYPPTIDV